MSSYNNSSIRNGVRDRSFVNQQGWMVIISPSRVPASTKVIASSRSILFPKLIKLNSGGIWSELRSRICFFRLATVESASKLEITRRTRAENGRKYYVRGEHFWVITDELSLKSLDPNSKFPTGPMVTTASYKNPMSRLLTFFALDDKSEDPPYISDWSKGRVRAQRWHPFHWARICTWENRPSTNEIYKGQCKTANISETGLGMT